MTKNPNQDIPNSAVTRLSRLPATQRQSTSPGIPLLGGQAYRRPAAQRQSPSQEIPTLGAQAYRLPAAQRQSPSRENHNRIWSAAARRRFEPTPAPHPTPKLLRLPHFSPLAPLTTLLIVTAIASISSIVSATTTLTTPAIPSVNDAAATINSTDWTATTLMVTGIVLLLLEIKIISQGILAFLGTASLIAATVLIWRDGTPFWGIPLGFIIPAIIVIIIVMGLLTYLAIQAQKEKIVTGYQGFIGEIAEAREPLNPEGRVFFNGTYWHAVSQTPIASGQKVRVIAADRLKLIVEPL